MHASILQGAQSQNRSLVLVLRVLYMTSCNSVYNISSPVYEAFLLAERGTLSLHTAIQNRHDGVSECFRHQRIEALVISSPRRQGGSRDESIAATPDRPANQHGDFTAGN